MSKNHKIKFYPVDNADTTLIKTKDSLTIQVDCQIRSQDEKKPGEVKIYDVKKDIINELERKNKNLTLDLFVLSHPHSDHCIGFEGNYYCGDPDKYAQENRENDEILIGELWVTQMIFGNDICEQAKAIRREAKRRRKLFEENPLEANKEGNRLRIIGYNDEDKKVDGLHYIPGETVNLFNGKPSSLLEVFIHAPFKADLITGKADKDHNATSIVMQISFRNEPYGAIKSRVILGGDADHYIWEKVLCKSQAKGNEDRLVWDILLSPHHCSWSFFNDRPYDDNKVPKAYSLEFLDYHTKNAYVVASSKKILDDDNNPPHYQAKLEYEKKVGSSHFRNTAIHKSEVAPKSLEFVIDQDGLTLIKSLVPAAAGIIGSTTPRAGRYGILLPNN